MVREGDRDGEQGAGVGRCGQQGGAESQGHLGKKWKARSCWYPAFMGDAQLLPSRGTGEAQGSPSCLQQPTTPPASAQAQEYKAWPVSQTLPFGGKCQTHTVSHTCTVTKATRGQFKVSPRWPAGGVRKWPLTAFDWTQDISSQPPPGLCDPVESFENTQLGRAYPAHRPRPSRAPALAMPALEPGVDPGLGRAWEEAFAQEHSRAKGQGQE